MRTSANAEITGQRSFVVGAFVDAYNSEEGPKKLQMFGRFTRNPLPPSQPPNEQLSPAAEHVPVTKYLFVGEASSDVALSIPESGLPNERHLCSFQQPSVKRVDVGIAEDERFNTR